jgi:diguanylate cyclase (GGDEF)-like protein
MIRDELSPLQRFSLGASDATEISDHRVIALPANIPQMIRIVRTFRPKNTSGPAMLSRWNGLASLFVENCAKGKGVSDSVQEKRVLAALVAANDAIIRASSIDEMRLRVCQAAISTEAFNCTAVMLVDAAGSLRVAAAAGSNVLGCAGVDASVHDLGRGADLANIALRTGRSCVSNDLENDERLQGKRNHRNHQGGGAAAALPVFLGDARIGVFYLSLPEIDSLTDEILRLVERLVENFSFALQKFEREKEKGAAERATRRITGMFAALSAVTAAILRVQNIDEMFKEVCTSVAKAGESLGAAAIFMKDPDSLDLKLAAAAGELIALIEKMPLSVDPESPWGGGLHGPAFRDQKLVISYDVEADPRMRPWVTPGTPPHGCAAVPLIKKNVSVGILFFFFGRTSGQSDPQVLQLMRDIGANVSFGLEKFEREKEKDAAERANRRTTGLFATLSTVNTAILRAQNIDEIFKEVCDSVAKTGKSLGAAAIFMADPDSTYLKLAAASGELLKVEMLPLSLDPQSPWGGGLHGPAFRDQKLVISYDVEADPRMRPWFVPGTVPFGCAVVPLIKNEISVGILVFFFNRTPRERDPQVMQLMRDIGANVSFGLEMFERKQEKESFTRMLAALSATNEAIIHAENREELYRLVCEAAVEGAKFTSTSIALHQQGNDFLRNAATAGPLADYIATLRFSVSAERPEGKGLSGTAFRSGKPAVANHFQGDPRTAHWHGKTDTKSGAALPLIVRGRTVGTFLFLSSERDTFTPDFVELLQRLAENVSFALEDFERIDEKHEAEKRIQYLGTHDGLTGLPNRIMFSQLLDLSIKSAHRNGQKRAILFIDLDRFKTINDTLGHAAGDFMLVEVARRLRSCVRESDMVARLGGDEFVVLLDDIADADQAAQVARKLLLSLSPPIVVAGHDCRTTASIGIALYPENGLDEQTLTKNADMAMYFAKDEGKNDFRFYSSKVRAGSIERLMLESSLRMALELGQFVLHYQPKVDSRTARITGVEALLRWNHPDLGTLAPMKFIPLAEETGLIIPIGRWVLETACEQSMTWQREGLSAVSMAVNLSPRQFTDEGLLKCIDQTLETTGLPPALLQLEITESMVMQNVERAIGLLDQIRGRGIHIAIDDFGTGYSSMSMMKKFPIDTIKIDRMFIRDLADNAEDRAIAAAIIEMGKALGLIIVAEGVETSAQEAFLRSRSCDELQGYLFSQPVTAQKMAELLGSLKSPVSLERLNLASSTLNAAE